MTTITREQFKAAEKAWRRAQGGSGLAEAFAAAGIAIAPPEPPEAMVKLAERICDASVQHWNASHHAAALAALQHAAKVVRDAPKWPSDMPSTTQELEACQLTLYGGRAVPEDHILRALGALS